MSDLKLRQGVRALISGGTKQLDYESLKLLTNALLEEAIVRRNATFFDAQEIVGARYEIPLSIGSALLVTPGGRCAKCRKWPGD